MLYLIIFWFMGALHIVLGIAMIVRPAAAAGTFIETPPPQAMTQDYGAHILWLGLVLCGAALVTEPGLQVTLLALAAVGMTVPSLVELRSVQAGREGKISLGRIALKLAFAALCLVELWRLWPAAAPG